MVAARDLRVRGKVVVRQAPEKPEKTRGKCGKSVVKSVKNRDVLSEHEIANVFEGCADFLGEETWIVI